MTRRALPFRRLHSPDRTSRTWMAALVLAAVAATTACSGQAPASSPRPARATGGSSATASTALKQLDDTWDQFRPVADRLEGKPLTLPALSATASFTAGDVGVFARLAKQITVQSIDPKLTAVSPEAAFRQAMAGTYAATRDNARSGLISAVTSRSWPYQAVSQFPKDAQLGTPQVIDARWRWGQQTGTLDDGTRSPQLWLGLQTFTRTPVTVKGETYPIVVRRTVLVRGFRPNGGPGWWPGVSFDSYPYGNDSCLLSSDSRLVPTRRVDGLRDDLKDLRSWLSPEALAPGSKNRQNIVWPDYSTARKARAKYSAAKRRQMDAKYKQYCATPTP